MQKLFPCRDRYHEPLREYQRKLKERIRNKKNIGIQLIRPEVNGFFADWRYWDTQEAKKGA